MNEEKVKELEAKIEHLEFKLGLVFSESNINSIYLNMISPKHNMEKLWI